MTLIHPESNHQEPIDYPGHTEDLVDKPQDSMENYAGNGLLAGKKALITGGDSGIGRAVAVAFAKEGADVAFSFLEEQDDAARTRALIERQGRRGVSIQSDLGVPEEARATVATAIVELGRIDILVNNAATQTPVERFEDITTEQWQRTFNVNVGGYLEVTRAALPSMPKGSSIINTASITGLRGHRKLIDYSATKGAILALTYSLAQALKDRGIRVNCVAPGPVWTPLIPATLPEEDVEKFGENAPYGRPAQPDEVAPSYVFFASPRMSSYYSGEVLAPIGGETLPG